MPTFSTNLKNAQLNEIPISIGATAMLRIYDGAVPADADAAATGNVLAQFSLSNPYFGLAAGGVISKAGTWAAPVSVAGTATYFRILNAAGTTTFIQGTVGAEMSGAELELSTNILTTDDAIVIDTFTVTHGN